MTPRHWADIEIFFAMILSALLAYQISKQNTTWAIIDAAILVPMVIFATANVVVYKLKGD